MVKVLSLHAPESHLGTGSNPGSPTSHPAPCLWPGKAGEDGPELGPCTHVGDPEEVPGSQLRTGAAPAVAVTWGVNGWLEDFTLFLLLSVHLTL